MRRRSKVEVETDAQVATEAEAEVEVEEEENSNAVKVVAVFNKMRNPYTGAIFNTSTPTDVIDLESPDNYWTRSQIKAKVLKVCK